MGEADEHTNSALTRRNAIKAAAAVGVGAAAWTGPKVGVFGASPAYAGVCSPGEESCITSGGSVNFGSTCGPTGQGNQPQYAEFNGVSGTITVEGIAATITAIGTGQAGKLCSFNQDLQINHPAGIACKVNLVVNGVTYANAFTTSGTTVIDVPQFVKFNDAGPGVPGISVPANAQYSLSVCCTTDQADCDGLP